MSPESYKVRIAGSGGQGVISAGIILADSFFQQKFHVMQTQTYGAAVRGSSATCDVIISKNELFEFTLDEVNYLIVLNRPSFDAYYSLLGKNGILILFKSLWNEVKHLININKYNVYLLDDQTILEEIQNSMSLSLSMIGTFIKIVQQIPVETVEESIKQKFSKEYHQVNIKAVRMGFQNVSKIK